MHKEMASSLGSLVIFAVFIVSICILIAIILPFTIVVPQTGKNTSPNTDWLYEPIYRISPGSFRDSNGDGIGDIKGIIEKLDYLNYLEIRNILLSDGFCDPRLDVGRGTGVSDFTRLHQSLSRAQDVEMLVKAARKYGMRILLEIDPTSTSSDHWWFGLSRRKESNPYKDFYIWQSGSVVNSNGNNPTPPSDQRTIYDRPAWNYSESRGIFYYHSHQADQPSLNYGSLRVQSEMSKVFRQWFDNGIEGIWLKHLDKLMTQDISILPANASLQLPSRMRILASWGQLAAQYGVSTKRSVKFLTECVAEDAVALDQIYIQPVSVDFRQLDMSTTGSNLTKQLAKWTKNMAKISDHITWDLGDSGVQRMATRMGDEKFSTAVLTMAFLLPGTPCSFYGDELGLWDLQTGYNRTLDTNDWGPERWKQFSKRPHQVIMPWITKDKWAGFTDAREAWQPLGNGTAAQTVQELRLRKISLLENFKYLIQFRLIERPLIESGLVTFYQSRFSDIVAYLRHSGAAKYRFLVVANLGHSGKAAKPDFTGQTNSEEAEIMFASGSYVEKVGKPVLLNNLEMSDGDCLILRIKPMENVI